MTLGETLLPEFDHEMGTTRALLERTPQGELHFRPHPKLRTLGALVSHVASLPTWIPTIIERNTIDLLDRSGEREADTFSTVAELLSAFDHNVSRARRQVASQSDAQLLAPWTLTRRGRELFTAPRLSVFKVFLVNHLIHHRGQLSVYLRLLNVPLPPIYGPSTDDAAL